MKRGRLRIAVYIFAMLSSGHAYSQQAGIAQFIPKGYEILDSASGNLNLDDMPDIVLVLNAKNEHTKKINPPKRMVVVLTGNAGGAYKLAAKSYNAVYTCNMGSMAADEPFSGLKVGEGTFSISHYGGLIRTKQTTETVFAYRIALQNWVLDNTILYTTYIDYVEDSDSLIVHETQENAVSSRKVLFEEYDIFKDNN